jgi:nucleotide-binding universal stress UspA family protein
MFANVLVGVDHHEGGRDAIALAQQLLTAEAELTLAHVYAGDPCVYRGVSAEYEAAKRQDDLELLLHTLEETGVQAQLRWRRASSVSLGLRELCEQLGADLLVVGASPRRPAGRRLLGDDTRGVLDGAPCPVAIAPAGYRRESVGMRAIGVGYDGSPECQRALRVARDIAAAKGSTLSAFGAVHVPTFDFHSPSPGDDEVAELVQAAYDQIADLGGIEARAAYGDPVKQLTLYSAGLDLLAIGAREYDPIRRPIHRSTARKLARTVHCPLLIVTASPRASDGPPLSAFGDVAEHRHR